MAFSQLDSWLYSVTFHERHGASRRDDLETPAASAVMVLSHKVAMSIQSFRARACATVNVVRIDRRSRPSRHCMAITADRQDDRVITPRQRCL